MTTATLTMPSTAERVRSACARAAGAMLVADGVAPAATPILHLLPGGTFAVSLPGDSALAARVSVAGTDGVAAVLELTDVAPLPLREPVRSLVWIRGRVQSVPDHTVRTMVDMVATEHPDPALLDIGSGQTLVLLEVESVVVADSAGAETVSLHDLMAAQPDPFCEFESAWLRHLDSDHPEVLARLAGKLPAPLRRGRVRPLGLDRYGVRLRVESSDGDHDVRLPFGAPVHDVPGLGRAIRLLMGCPFVNGLRARRM
ncbi:DUF2470 domain-containing protein [Mycobacterium sp. CVI_P3]|uniref:DUF2470 domain-containing protein n=1 Tax=Mycobacterium pinniadriaticum TaxID=2994102 RepID=A0ABT3SL24_9MYCO|nr:DUF2470 domain-containing protein [Mycobacterium pinniadriaticum]MCX2933478.1 DUF2470 domain-containing protein [Mycobacterium pinniadriaticum]MCX2939883.1 DUF2470 domain-containing protein [Mycobacterium pinniadriaticum]